MRHALKFLAACAAVVMLASPAVAQMACGDRVAISQQLDTAYGERTTSLGLTADGLLMEVFSSPGGTWTIIVSYPTGQACVVAHGTDWQSIPVKSADIVS